MCLLSKLYPLPDPEPFLCLEVKFWRAGNIYESTVEFELNRTGGAVSFFPWIDGMKAYRGRELYTHEMKHPAFIFLVSLLSTHAFCLLLQFEAFILLYSTCQCQNPCFLPTTLHCTALTSNFVACFSTQCRSSFTNSGN